MISAWLWADIDYAGALLSQGQTKASYMTISHFILHSVIMDANQCFTFIWDAWQQSSSNTSMLEMIGLPSLLDADEHSPLCQTFYIHQHKPKGGDVASVVRQTYEIEEH